MIALVNGFYSSKKEEESQRAEDGEEVSSRAGR